MLPSFGRSLQTREDYERLPGVVEVLSATPEPGWVTLVVESEAYLGYPALLGGDGSGTGSVPIGTHIATRLRGET